MLHVLIGGLVGAVVGAGAAVAKSLIAKKPIDWKSVAAGAIGGAATGALAAATFGAGLLAGSAATEITGLAVAGATGGAVEQASDNVLHDRTWHEGVAEQAAVGGALGVVAGAGRVVAPSVGRALAKVPVVRALGRQAQRVLTPLARGARRVAAPGISATKRAWGAYMAAMKRWPMRTKMATSGSLTLAGDLLSQKLEGRTTWDWKRTLYRTGWGVAISAPVGHYWMVGLDKLIPATGTAATIGKVAVDQLFFNPVTSSAFFGGYAMFHDGASPGEAWQRIKSDVPRAAAASLSVWPAVNFVKFKYVPLHQRIPFGKAFGLVYNVFFGMFFLADKKPGEDPEEDARNATPLDIPQPARDGTMDVYANAWGQLASHYEGITLGDEETGDRPVRHGEGWHDPQGSGLVDELQAAGVSGGR